MSLVSVVSSTIVPVLRDPTNNPRSNDPIRLSFFDAFWIALPPIQRLFLFHHTAGLPLSSLADALKSSLSSTLQTFHPLAGKLTYLPDSRDVVVAVAEGDSVITFIEAESDGDLPRLITEEVHDTAAFIRLVPELDARVLPAPVLAVQLTSFAGGGATVGIAAHHAVIDGRGLWRFVEDWAASCRRTCGCEAARSIDVGDSGCGGAPPSHDRAVIRVQRREEITRKYLKLAAPNLPIIKTSPVTIEDRLRLSRRTFTISSAIIQSLKQRAMHQSNKDLLDHHQPSTFATISAHSWISLTKAKALKDHDHTCVLAFLADCRTRITPPISQGFTGNCVKGCYAEAKVSDLLTDGGLAVACSAIKKAIDESLEDPLRGCEDWADEYLKLRLSGKTIVHSAGSPRFKAYEAADFGWGRPSRVELVSMNHDGEVVLLGAKEEGGTQVSVALPPSQMQAFASHFVE